MSQKRTRDYSGILFAIVPILLLAAVISAQVAC
jgi:hypothetical protein